MQKVLVFQDRDRCALDDAIHDIFFRLGGNVLPASIEVTDSVVEAEVRLVIVPGLVMSLLREDAAFAIDVDLGEFGGLRWTHSLCSVNGLCKGWRDKGEKHDAENRTGHRCDLLTS
jgi:hypothetical protein